MMIAVRAVFREENKYCSQVFLDECLYKSQMLKYDAIEVSGGINVNNTDGLHGCIICHYWYFLNINFRF